jgi:hypothetical protein
MVRRNAERHENAEGYEMGTDHSHPIDPTIAERLLRDRAGGPPPLVELLAAAAAPGRESELGGEQSAVVAFRMAQRAAPATASGPSARSRWARFVTVKVAAVGLAIATAGVALAAGTGVLPNPLNTRIPPPAPTGAPGTSAVVTAGVPGHPTTANASGAANLFGLCTAYLAHVAAHPDTPWPNPALATLTQAAAGADRVTAFCTALVEAAKSGPTKGPGNSTAHPTGPPSPHPTGDPGHGPTSHPAHEYGS